MIQIAIFIKSKLFLLLEFLCSSKVNSDNKNVLFVNTGQIGDLLVSSVILENDELFTNDVYFLFDRRYQKLFKTYSGSVKLLPVRISLYRYFFLYRYYILNRLKKKMLRISVNITAARGFINDEITLLSGANRKYTTCSTHYFLGSYYGSLFDNKYDEILFKDTKNEYEKNFRIISFITDTKENQIRFINKKTFSLEPTPLKDYICISPFSSLKLKDWNIENYKYLIEYLCKTEKILLLGSKKQKNKLKYLKSDCSNIEIVNCGLDEIPEIISKCKLFIGNDSGLTHIAYRLGKPLIGIIGGGCFDIFFPYKNINKNNYYFYHNMECFGCRWNCVYDESYCLKEVDKKLVLDKILQILLHGPNKK